MLQHVPYVLLGLFSGVLAGLIGVGGGVIILPILIYFFGMQQHNAQGTTLALLVPPIGILAAWTYYKEGFVDFRIAGLICAGFFLGGLFGAKLAIHLPREVLRKVFGVALLIVSLDMILRR